jgi:hypothetical protein
MHYNFEIHWTTYATENTSNSKWTTRTRISLVKLLCSNFFQVSNNTASLQCIDQEVNESIRLEKKNFETYRDSNQDKLLLLMKKCSAVQQLSITFIQLTDLSQH